MADLDTKFRTVDQVRPPDMWGDIGTRLRGLPEGGSQLPIPPTPPGRRIVAGVVAVAVFAAAAVFALRAFDGDNAIDVGDPVVTSAELVETSWVLMTIDGETALDDPWYESRRWTTLSFEPDGVVLQTECNSFVAPSFKVDGPTLAVSDGATTTTGCDGDAAVREDVAFEVFSAGPSIALEGVTMRLATPDHALAFQQDPCTVLTDEQVAVATASQVVASGLVPPNRYRVPPIDGASCSYDVPGTYTSVGVQLRPGSLAAFEADRDRDPRNTVIVEGIGDGAFIHALASIEVLSGDRLITIGLQHGAGSDAVDVLEALARAAVDAPPAPEPALNERLVISVEEVAGGSVAYPPVLRARYDAASIRLEPIAVTPNGELTYPTVTLPIDIPVGTPIAFENATGYRLRVWNLESAGSGEMVDHAAIHDRALESFDTPGNVAISIEYSNQQAWSEVGLIVHVVDRATPEDLTLAEGAAGNGTWTLTTYGGADPQGVQLHWRGDDGGVLLKRASWHDDVVTVGTISAADRGDPDDEVVFGVAPWSAISVTHVPGQGLPETTVDAIEVPGARFTAFVVTSYAGIGVVSAFDADPEDGSGWWRTLIVPEGGKELLRTVEAFLQARIDGEGAERFLLDDEGGSRFTARAAPSDDADAAATLPLYDAFDHAVVLFIDAPIEADTSGTVGAAEVGVLIEGSHGASYETLNVVRQPDGRYLISLARPGSEGP